MEPAPNEHLAEQLLFQEYALVVDETAKLSDRRQTVNDIYIGLNVLFLTAMGVAFVSSHLQSWWVTAICGLIAVFTTLFNTFWYRTVNRYQNLVRARYRYLRGIERKMQQQWPAIFPAIALPAKEPPASQPLSPLPPGAPSAAAHEFDLAVRGIYLFEDALREISKKQRQRNPVVFGFARLEKGTIIVLSSAYWLIAGLIALATYLISSGVWPPVKL